MTTTLHRICTVAAALLSAAAWARPPHVLVTSDLSTIPGEVRVIDQDSVSFVGDTGRLRTRPIDSLVAILPDQPRPAPPAHDRMDGQVKLELVDGQRLAVEMLALTGDAAPTREGFLSVRVARTELEIPLERIKRILLPEAPRRHTSHRDPVEDRVVLANGDALDGFIESIGATVVIDGETRQQIPLARVVEIVLANPVEPSRGALVWLIDGSVLAASTIESRGEQRIAIEVDIVGETPEDDSDSERGLASPGAIEMVMPLSRVAAIRFDRPDHRLLGLSELDIIAVEPGQGRRWTPPPVRVGAPVGGVRPVHLPGPMRVRWMLPPQGGRIGGELALSESTGRWADCHVAISAIAPTGSIELYSTALRSRDSRAEFTLDVPSGANELVIEVNEGRYGPIQDHVVLERAYFLVNSE